MATFTPPSITFALLVRLGPRIVGAYLGNVEHSTYCGVVKRSIVTVSSTFAQITFGRSGQSHRPLRLLSKGKCSVMRKNAQLSLSHKTCPHSHLRPTKLLQWLQNALSSSCYCKYSAAYAHPAVDDCDDNGRKIREVHNR